MNGKNLILLVDDDPDILKRAQTLLGTQYKIAAASCGEQALIFVRRHVPDLILLDIMMPGMDGFQTLREIHTISSCVHVPVIFLTGDTDAATEARCFSMGAIDFIGKPFVPQVLMGRVRRILENEMYRRRLEEMVEEKVREITGIQESIITGIANLIESRDGSTGSHVKKTRDYVAVLTRELQKRNLHPDILTEDYAENVIKAAVLHDVGKIKISDGILTKPGRLTPEEFEKIKLHTIYGDEIVEDIIGDVENPDYVRQAREIARYHHERWDGTGYPDGLSGEDIPLGARIMALADVFDALAEKRCYKEPIRPLEKVFAIVEENAGTQFDPLLAEVFLDCKDRLIQILKE